MSEWNSNDIDQFWGLTEDLADAITHWKASPDADRAFYVTLCVGHCRLYNVSQSLMTVDDFAAESVFVELFYSAWREGRRMIDLIVDESDNEAGLMQLVGGIEARTLALDVLQSRLLFEGLRLFFEELQQSASISSDTAIAESFRHRLAVYRQMLEHFDEAIDEHPEQMSLAVQSTWPHNVRMTLPNQAWLPLPWWLTERANAILEDHLQLVLHLSDAQLSGLIVASPQAQGVSLARPADAVVEPQETPDFSLAADSNLSASLIELAEFRGEGEGWNLSSRLQVSVDYRDMALYQLPAAVPCHGSVSIIENSDSQFTTDDPQQLWRLRWGPLVIDVQLAKLASSLATEWLGDFKITAGQLQNLVCENSWLQQHWRRLS